MSCHRHELDNLFNLQPWTPDVGRETKHLQSLSPIIKKIRQKKKETANMPTFFKLAKAFLYGLNLLISNFFACPLPVENPSE
jgi:hypothetical protein